MILKKKSFYQYFSKSYREVIFLVLQGSVIFYNFIQAISCFEQLFHNKLYNLFMLTTLKLCLTVYSLLNYNFK